jgi:lysophospholipase L1-like esterase
VPPTISRRFALRAWLVVTAMVALATCSSDRGTLTAPSFGTPEDSVPTLDTGGDVPADSITVGSEEPLQDAFRDLGLDVQAIDAASGRRISAGGGAGSSGVDAVVALAPSRPDLWVIALGTNDVFQYDDEDSYRNEIAALLKALPPDAPVVWVDTYLAEDPERSAEFNRALRDTLAFRGTASMADWANVAGGDGVLRDGIHPSEEGAQMFADVVMAGLEPWLG